MSAGSRESKSFLGHYQIYETRKYIKIIFRVTVIRACACITKREDVNIKHESLVKQQQSSQRVPFAIREKIYPDHTLQVVRSSKFPPSTFVASKIV